MQYSLYGPYAQNFTINPTTGAISTVSTFDREATSNHYYLLNVRVNDGFPSARPGANGQPNSGMQFLQFKNMYLQYAEVAIAIHLT